MGGEVSDKGKGTRNMEALRISQYKIVQHVNCNIASL
jgi:hypothetical protein